MEARKLAFEILMAIKTEGAYSNNALNETFKNNELSSQDKGLVTEIVYGTLTNYNQLIYWLEPFFQGRIKEWIQILLAMTLYQTKYLEKIPQYAAINEAVKIAKNRGGSFNSKLVNAILRKVGDLEHLRDADDLDDESEKLAITYSHPLWLVKLWIAQYGPGKTLEMLRANNRKSPLVLRTNLDKIERKELMFLLRNENIDCHEGLLCTSSIIVKKGNPLNSTAFKEGMFYIQDEASMLPAIALAPEKNHDVLDTCAAPGGKTLHLAEMVAEAGMVYAHDIHEHKISKIKENAKRMDIHNVVASVCSALDLDKVYDRQSFKYVLVDAPCSGLGILRRHPEAKLTKKPGDIDAIVKIQENILQNASRFVKPGGRLVYSTCTVNKKENQRQIEFFLKNNTDFELDLKLENRMPKVLKDNFEDGMLQLFPQDFETDGFFIAALIKKEKRMNINE